jgi:hypothetical protein
MRCSNPDCNRGIGLVAYRRGWFSKRRYCSKHCRDAFVADALKRQQKRSALSSIGVTAKRLAECGSVGSLFLIWLFGNKPGQTSKSATILVSGCLLTWLVGMMLHYGAGL